MPGKKKQAAPPLALPEPDISYGADGSRFLKYPDLNFEIHIKKNEYGQEVLHFLFMAHSDIHFGTKHCRAKRFSHMCQYTSSDIWFLVGDIVDGEYMLGKNEWKFADWHRQGLSHIQRKTAQGTRTFYIPGNHDMAVRGQKIGKKGSYHRNLCGREIAGIRVVEQKIYTDPHGRRIKIIHGDQFDDQLFGAKKASLYHIGDVAYGALMELDTAFQKLPKCGHISLAAIGKRAVKTTINDGLGVRRSIMSAVDGDPSIDGILYGHSHMAEISHTPLGKLLMNDGCCTEHVQAIVHDRQGNYALLEWHMDRMILTAENGRQRTIRFDELGLASLSQEPRLYDDEHTETTDRLCRVMYRVWPPKERQRLKKKTAFRRAAKNLCMPPPPLPKKQRPVRNILKRTEKLAA